MMPDTKIAMNITRIPKTIRIASRASALALTQAEFVKNKLQKKMPDTKIFIVKIATFGDKDKSRKAFEKFPTGIFVKQIEEALLTGKADIAVHSLKDLPSADTKKLTIAAYVKRLSPNDVLISAKKSLKQLAAGASVGTGSLRRASQIRMLRPDLKIIPIRGNVPTRIQMVENNKIQAVILAAAGIQRLDLEKKYFLEKLSPAHFIPAAGQATLAVQTRNRDKALTFLIADILDDQKTRSASIAERECMRRLKAGCRVPVGVYAKIQGGKLIMKSAVYTISGSVIKASHVGSPGHPVKSASAVAAELKKLGAVKILKDWRLSGYE